MFALSPSFSYPFTPQVRYDIKYQVMITWLFGSETGKVLQIKYKIEHLQQPSLLLYFSDTQGTFPELEPMYEVMWVSGEKAEVPFGEVLVVENSVDE